MAQFGSKKASNDRSAGSPSRRRHALLAAYLRGGADLTFVVGPDAIIVAEQVGFYTLYSVAMTGSDGSRYRHLLIVPTNISAVSFDVGLALLEAHSAEVDAGRFGQIDQLANALKADHRRYRVFPPPAALNRFCM